MEHETNGPGALLAHFNRVYDETFEELRRYVAIQCADVSSIADILQETYLAYYRALLRRGVDYAKEPRALLRKIAKRRVYAYYSLREGMKRLLPLGRGADEADWEIPDARADFTGQALERAEAARIWQTLAAYPADVRKIFYLFYYENLSHAQIAATLRCNVSSVKNKLYRTIHRIREEENRDA